MWRAAQSDPDVQATAGTQPSWPPAPTMAAPVQILDFCSSWSPPTSLSSQCKAGHPPSPGPPSFPAGLQPPAPAWRWNSLFPECSRLPSPTARPSRSSQNPRPSAPLPGPQPYPSDQGRGRGLRPGAARLRTPHCFPAAVPGPSGHPSGTQASPTHGFGVWERRKAESSPRGLNPLNALPLGRGARARCRGLWGPSQGVIPG